MAQILINGEQTSGQIGRGDARRQPRNGRRVRDGAQGAARRTSTRRSRRLKRRSRSGRRRTRTTARRRIRAAVAKIEENGKEMAGLLTQRAGQAVLRVDGRVPPLPARHELLRRPREQDRGRLREPALRARQGLRHGHQEADGRVRRDRALQLPADADGHEGRPGAGRRQHHRGQAGRHHAAGHAAGRRADAGGGAPARRRERRDGAGQGGRGGARHPP